MKPKMLDKGKGIYEYCGYRVVRNDSIPPGQYGHWSLPFEKVPEAGSMVQIQKTVDNLEYERGKQAARDNKTLPDDCYPEFERGWRDEVDAIAKKRNDRRGQK